MTTTSNAYVGLAHNYKSIAQKIKARFKQFILGEDHPCIMARSIFNQGNVEFHVYEDFGRKVTAEKILADLKKFIASYDENANKNFTFIASFKDRRDYTEIEFEKKLWRQLQYLHELDDSPWDSQVSDDKESGQFSFSLGGKAFYIVGLHPNSSRKARQSPYPALVFNLHLQFERLREMGKYEHVRDKIRERDTALQGSLNPMMEDFGDESEAKQYSGRNVGSKWKCPFHRK